VKIWIRIRINVAIQELRLKLALWTLTMEAWRLKIQPWVCRPLAGDSHHFDEEPDPDPIKVKSRIRIRIKVMQIRNPLLRIA
jgi:hypothetical protein